jgi:hypothetical protein
LDVDHAGGDRLINFNIVLLVVANEGSLILAGVEVVNAEPNGCQRLDSCCTPKTVTAAKTAEANATTKICLAETLYIGQTPEFLTRSEMHVYQFTVVQHAFAKRASDLRVPEQL